MGQDTEPLRLIAFDEEDLAIVSAHLQDALLRVGDIINRPAERRFALALRRFDWEGAVHGERRRRLTALHFEGVRAVRALKIDPALRDTHLTLLAITFAPASGPEGEVTLHFSDGAAIRLDVECVEAQMKDIGEVGEAGPAPMVD